MFKYDSVSWLVTLRALSALFVFTNLNSGQASVVYECPNVTSQVELNELNIIVTQESHEPAVTHHNNLTCLGPDQPLGESHLQHRASTCPWEIKNDTDYDRTPHTIIYALCKCKNCTTPPNNGFCIPVKKDFSVIRRYCENGTIRLKHMFERFPVACVCVPKMAA